MLKKLKVHFDEDKCAERGEIPVMFGRAVPPNKTKFDWKDFCIRTLIAAGDVVTDKKIFVPRSLALFPELAQAVSLNAQTAASLRRALEQCLRDRNVRVLFIDEAHHFLMVPAADLEAQFEHLKSLAEETQTIIVLVGTYGLLGIRDGSGQLVRRSRIITFPRYNNTSVDDLSAFRSTLEFLVNSLPGDRKPDLTKHLDEIQTGSIGCIGILKDWMMRTLEATLRDGVAFTFDRMKEHAMSNKEVYTLTHEAYLGEAKMADISDVELETKLAEDRLQIFGADRVVQQASAQRPNVRQKTGAGGRIGLRKPTRDPVGGAYHA